MTDEIKPKKPIWKKWWLWIGAFLIIIIIASAGGEEKKETTPEQQLLQEQEQIQVQETSQASQEEQKESVEEKGPAEEREAIEEKVPPESKEASANKIIRVIDGDTFDVLLTDETQDTIRLLGVDTPETYSKNKPNEYGTITNTSCLDEWGNKATQYAENVLENKKVFLSYDPIAGERGYYRRLLAYIEINGQDFGELLLENGYARVYTESDFQKEDNYIIIQQKAISNKIGLWSCEEEPQTSQPASQTEHAFYLSTYHSAKYYYCDTDDGWKGLSEKYLKSYSSKEALLEDYPDRILHEPCE